MAELICDLCENTGVIPVERDGIYYASFCGCKIKSYNTKNLESLLRSIPQPVRKNLSYREIDGKFTIHEFVKKPDQVKTCEKLTNKMWLYGDTRKGKSHIIAERVILMAQKAERILSMRWMEAKDFDDLLLMQYGEQADKLEYSKIKRRMAKLDILVLNDWDKIGKGPDKKYSTFKSNEIKDFADNVFPEIKVFIVTANCSMESFMTTFADQEVAPTIWSRFSEDLTPNEVAI